MTSRTDPEPLIHAAPKKPILVILHQEHSTAGHVGRLLLARGHPLDIRRPRFGDPLPATLADHAGAVIFGGPMSANDPDDYVKREIALIETALKEVAPYLGICLGAQMMAACLGARVACDKDGFVEFGYHAIEPNPVQRFGGRWPDRVYQWHSEGFELPSGAESLASAASAFPNQAFAVGPSAIGLQFHPEITYGMIARWSGRNEHRLTRPGAQHRTGQLSDHVVLGPGVRDWLSRFLADWLMTERRDTPQNEFDICNFATSGDYKEPRLGFVERTERVDAVAASVRSLDVPPRFISGT